MAGLRLPIESHVLQAFVTEPVKPMVHHVVSWGAELFYLSQSDKGGMVFGGHIDGFNSYAQRGNFAVMHDRGGMRRVTACPSCPGCACCATGAASWT